MLTVTPQALYVVPAGPNKAAKAKEEEEWRKPIPIDMKFGVGLKTRPPRNRPMAPSSWGWIIFVFYIATFAFYAYCRIAHTLDSHDPAFAYQVCFTHACCCGSHVGSRLSCVSLWPCRLLPVNRSSSSGKR